MIPDVTVEVLRFFRVVELDHLKMLGQLLRSVIVRNASTLPTRYPYDDVHCFLSRDDLDAVQLAAKRLSEIVQTRGSKYPLRSLKKVTLFAERGSFRASADNRELQHLISVWVDSMGKALRELNRLSKNSIVANFVIYGVDLRLQPGDLHALAVLLRTTKVGRLEFMEVDLSLIDGDAFNALLEALAGAKLKVSRCRISTELDEILHCLQDERDSIAAEENDIVT